MVGAAAGCSAAVATGTCVSVVVVVVEVDSWMGSEADSSFTATDIVDGTTHIIRTMHEFRGSGGRRACVA